MSWFSKSRTSEEQENYESYMTGFRLGYPVDEDEPGSVYINPNDPEFRRGLRSGVTSKQENEAYLAAHPNWEAEQAEIDNRMREQYRRK